MSTIQLINSGVPYAAGNVLPATDVNTMNSNALLTWMLAIQHKQRVQGVPAEFPHLAASQVVDPSYSPLAQWVLFDCGDWSHAVSKHGDIVHVMDNGVYVENRIAGSYEPDFANYRIERWPTNTSGATGLRYTTSALGFGDTWNLAVTPNFRARWRPVWLGGPNNVRIVPGQFSSTDTDTCLMVAVGTATYNRHDLAFGAAPRRIAHNGSGGIVAASATQIWYASNYGINLVDWTNVAMPSGAYNLGTVGLAYDATRELFVMVAVRAGTTNEVIFSTSPTGAVWQAWRRLIALGNIASNLDIECFNGAWAVQAGAPEAPGTNYASTMVVSLDGGATWASLGRCFSRTEGLTSIVNSSMSLLQAGDRLVSLYNFKTEQGVVLDFMGPIDSPTLTASVAI